MTSESESPRVRSRSQRAKVVALVAGTAVGLLLIAVAWLILESREPVPNVVPIDGGRMVQTDIPGVPILEGPRRGERSPMGFIGSSAPSLRKWRGDFRVIVVGDSVTTPQDNAPDSAFPNVAAELLEADPRFGRVEVLNLSYSGMSFRQEMALIEHRAMPFEPDLLVIAYCYNDLVETFIRDTANAWEDGTAFHEAVRDSDRWYDEQAPYLDRFRSDLERLDSVRQGVPVVFVAPPRRRTLNAPASNYLEVVTPIIEDAGYEMLDLRDSLSEPLRGSDYMRDDDIHFTRIGHRKVAAAFVEALADYLPPAE